MLFTVYHAVNSDFGMSEPQAFNAINFRKVAEVECEDLNQVYLLTNSIEYHWGDNEGVKMTGPRTRSTSIGDVIASVDECKAWRVASTGFSPLEDADLKA